MKPKLLLVADTYYPKVDGTLRFMEEFIKRAEDAFQISLLVPRLHPDERWPQQKQETVYLEPSRRIAISGYPNLKLSWRNLKKIKESIRRADIVFIQGPGAISYLATHYAQKYGKKTVSYIHVLIWELFAKFLPPSLHKPGSAFLKKLFLHCYGKNDLILVPYAELKEFLQNQGISSRIVVTRLGVDILRFLPARNKQEQKKLLGFSHSDFVVGYVGRISKEKNIQILINAFRKLASQDKTSLLLVGDGPERQKKACLALPRCQVTGFVKDVEKYLQAMDVFVMPSLTETTSLATLEAMACGVPVIVTKVGFMKKYVKRDYNGLFFPKNNSTMLALKLEKLRGDKKLGERLGNQARKTIAAAFSWERSINKIKRLLMEEYFTT